MEKANFLKAVTGGGGGAKGISDPTSIAAIKDSEEIKSVVIWNGKYHKETVYNAQKWLMALGSLMLTYKHEPNLLKFYKAKFVDKKSDLWLVNECIVGSAREASIIKHQMVCDLVERAKFFKLL